MVVHFFNPSGISASLRMSLDYGKGFLVGAVNGLYNETKPYLQAVRHRTPVLHYRTVSSAKSQ